MSNYRTTLNNGALGIGLPIYDLSEGRLDKPNQVVFDTTKPHPNYNTKDGEGGYPRFALDVNGNIKLCLLYTSPSPRDAQLSRMPSSA